MSFIMEQAGGLSTTGTQRVMEISPEAVHQRVPIIMGSRNDVQEVIDAYAAAAAANHQKEDVVPPSRIDRSHRARLSALYVEWESHVWLSKPIQWPVRRHNT